MTYSHNQHSTFFLFTASTHPTAFPFLSARNTSWFFLSKPQSVFWLFTSQPSSLLPPLFSFPRDFWWAAKKKKEASMDSYRAPSTSQGDCNHGHNFLFFFLPPHTCKANLFRETKEGALCYLLMWGFLVSSLPALLYKLTQWSRREDRTVEPLHY